MWKDCTGKNTDKNILKYAREVWETLMTDQESLTYSIRVLEGNNRANEIEAIIHIKTQYKT